MSGRSTLLVNNEIYHIYNRSIAKEPIFLSKLDLRKAVEIVDYYRFPQQLRLSKYKSLPSELKKSYLASIQNIDPIVEIYAYSFMPNHFHFLLKQKTDKGITQFLSNFQNSFAKIYNLRNDRQGNLLQRPFKARRIEGDEEFIHVARYIHINQITSYIINFEDLANYPWSSYSHYMNDFKSFVNTEMLLKMFGEDKFKLAQFTANQVDYQRRLDNIKHLILD